MGSKTINTIRSNAVGRAERSGALYSNKQYFAVTMKATGKELPSSSYYQDLIDSWSKKGLEFTQVCYELDSQRRLHLHGTVLLPKNFYRKSLDKKGLSHRLVEIEDNDNLIQWTKYIEKQYENIYQQEQLLQINDIQIAYSFK